MTPLRNGVRLVTVGPNTAVLPASGTVADFQAVLRMSSQQHRQELELSGYRLKTFWDELDGRALPARSGQCDTDSQLRGVQLLANGELFRDGSYDAERLACLTALLRPADGGITTEADTWLADLLQPVVSPVEADLRKETYRVVCDLVLEKAGEASSHHRRFTPSLDDGATLLRCLLVEFASDHRMVSELVSAVAGHLRSRANHPV